MPPPANHLLRTPAQKNHHQEAATPCLRPSNQPAPDAPISHHDRSSRPDPQSSRGPLRRDVQSPDAMRWMSPHQRHPGPAALTQRSSGRARQRAYRRRCGRPARPESNVTSRASSLAAFAINASRSASSSTHPESAHLTRRGNHSSSGPPQLSRLSQHAFRVQKKHLPRYPTLNLAPRRCRSAKFWLLIPNRLHVCVDKTALQHTFKACFENLTPDKSRARFFTYRATWWTRTGCRHVRICS